VAIERGFRANIKLSDFVRDYFRNLNMMLFWAMMALIVTGLIAIYSATVQSGLGLFWKQVLWFLIGFAFFFFFSTANYNYMIAAANWMFAIFVLILIFVLFAGHSTLGAQRWIKIGAFQFQPSEFMKFIIPLVLIRFILVEKEPYSWKGILKAIAITLAPMLLIIKQPDLGTSIILIPVLLGVLFFGNVPLKKFITIITGGLLLLPVVYFFLKDYQKQRIETFLNPQLDPLGAGYNVIQSQIAVGSGELLGKGFLQGTQSQLNFIPIKYTDFIFAVIAEEFGFMGSLLLVALYFFLVMECLRVVKISRYNGGKMLSGALTMVVFAQFFINIGMNIGIMPVTGITLPLLSYGGTSVLVIMIILGIIQNIYRETVRGDDK